MGYKDWKVAFEPVAGTDAKRYAQLWNLDNERRINKKRGLCKRRIGVLFGRQPHHRTSPQQAAASALDEVIRETRPVGSKWLGALPVPANAPLPVSMATHMTSTELSRYRVRTFINWQQPHRGPVQLAQPLKTTTGPGGVAKPVTRFIWVTFHAGGRAMPDDPTVAKKELGLAHFPSGRNVFMLRCALKVDPGRLLIPTCLEAGLREAWAPPPRGHDKPWGMTRDLSTGQPRWPELLTETTDHMNKRPTAMLVSPPGSSPMSIGPVPTDYKANRP